MKKIKAVHRNHKALNIRLKILLFYIPLIIIPLILVAAISNQIFGNAAKANARKNITEESELIKVRTEGIINSGQTCATAVIRNINTVYRNFANGDEGSPVCFAAMQNQLLASLSYDLQAFPDIDSIIYVDNNFNVVTSKPVIIDRNGLAENKIIKKMQGDGPPTNIWHEIERRDNLVSYRDEVVLTYSKKVLNENTGKRIGYLIININENTLSSAYDFGQAEEGKTYQLMDKSGNCVSALDKEMLFKETIDKSLLASESVDDNKTKEVTYKDSKYLLNITNIDKVDLSLVCLADVNILTREAKVNNRIILLIVAACVLATFGVSAILSKAIARPIVTLTGVAEEVRKGNLQIRSSVESEDEIGILSTVFNEMIANTKLLIKNVKKEQKQKREYELALVQAQINPHFLYNTLDLIYVLCQMKDVDAASEITKSLSDFYRVSLSQGKTMILISEELENVEAYLNIQKNRYEDILEYEMYIDEDIKQCPILKLTLQPLVENAIYHGIKPQGGGKITVSGEKVPGFVILQVIDTGVGIDAENLKVLNQFKSESEGKNSFGLSNVNERIKLYFGDQYGLKIESESGAGTKVKIRLPNDVG